MASAHYRFIDIPPMTASVSASVQTAQSISSTFGFPISRPGTLEVTNGAYDGLGMAQWPSSFSRHPSPLRDVAGLRSRTKRRTILAVVPSHGGLIRQHGTLVS